MLKWLYKYLDFKVINNVLIVSLLYIFLFNMAVFYYKIDLYTGQFFRTFTAIFQEFLATYIALFLLFFGLLINRTIFLIASIFLFFTGAIASYYLFFFAIAPDAKMIQIIFGSNGSEVTELVSTRLMIWVIFSLAICLYTIKHFAIETTKSFLTKFLMSICLLISINNIIRPYYFVASYYPFQYLHGTYIYFLGNEEQKERKNITHKYGFSLTKDE